MISAESVLTPWNKSWGYLFGLLLCPIGVVFWAVSGPLQQRNHWSIFTPGFYTGLVISFLLAFPVLIVKQFAVTNYYKLTYKKGAVGQRQAELLDNVHEIYKELAEYVEQKYGHQTRISEVYDKFNRQTRIHLLYNENKGNIIFTMDHANNTIAYRYGHTKVEHFDFDDIKTQLLKRINEGR